MINGINIFFLQQIVLEAVFPEAVTSPAAAPQIALGLATLAVLTAPRKIKF